MDNTKLKIFLATAIFGTTGFFMRYINMPAAAVAFFCGLLGIITLFTTMKLTSRKFRWKHIKKSFPVLLLSGVALGGSWLLLMQSNRYTPNSLGTILYYIAPIVLMLLGPRMQEKLNHKKLTWGGVALVGIVLSTGFWANGWGFNPSILFSVGAAILYMVVVFCNKTLPDMYSYDKAVVQLGVATVMMLPYCLMTDGFTFGEFGSRSFAAIVILGVVHMGIAYKLYFDSIARMKLQSVAMFSYTNPAVALVISAFMLKQIDLGNVFGAVLILTGVMCSELIGEKIGRIFDKKG